MRFQKSDLSDLPSSHSMVPHPRWKEGSKDVERLS